jgi:hypothetical protein
MNDSLLDALRFHIERQSSFVLRANLQLQEALLLGDEPWYEIQILLGAAANLQKAFWGSGGKNGEERAPLRAMFGVQDDSPLNAPNDLRNNFEHYDQKLERWAQESAHHHRVSGVGRGPVSAFAEQAGIELLNRLHYYDVANQQITFWGDEFALDPILAEVQRIWHLAQEMNQIEKARTEQFLAEQARKREARATEPR